MMIVARHYSAYMHFKLHFTVPATNPYIHCKNDNSDSTTFNERGESFCMIQRKVYFLLSFFDKGQRTSPYLKPTWLAVLLAVFVLLRLRLKFSRIAIMFLQSKLLEMLWLPLELILGGVTCLAVPCRAVSCRACGGSA